MNLIQNRVFLVLSTFLLCLNLNAQFFEKISVKIAISEKNILNPNVGGLNSPQIYSFLINDDSFEDLIIYDKNAHVFNVFIYNPINENFVHDINPQFQFPILSNWAVVVDYDRDGILDIFAYPDQGAAGIEVWKGEKEGGITFFKKLQLYQGIFNILYFPSTNGKVNLYVSSADHPAIKDINGDGDLDVATFDPSGGYLYYFENKSVEKGYGFDSLIYERADLCYGKFLEDAFSSEIRTSNDPNTCFINFAEVIKPRHSGSTTTIYDLNQDGKLDLLIGDISSPKIAYLENNGQNNVKSHINYVENEFPAGNDPVHINSFPACYPIHINDGIKTSLLFTSNTGGISDDSKSIWKFDRESDGKFKLKEQNYLFGDILDLGWSAYPAFIDMNLDGKLDMIVGNDIQQIPEGAYTSKLRLFINTSSQEELSFKLKDDDFLGFGSNNLNLTGLKPVFYDIDHDNQMDLFIGNNNGDILHFENINTPSEIPNFILQTEKYFNLNIITRTSPGFIDADNDGLEDIICGEKNGYFAFIKNVGSYSTPFFNTPFNQGSNKYRFGKVNTRIDGQIDGSSTVSFLNFLGKKLLVSGSTSGKIFVYDQITGDTAVQMTQIENFGSNIYEGAYSYPQFIDLNGDQTLEFVLGNIRGGLSFFKTNIKTNGSIDNKQVVNTKFKIFPSMIQPGSMLNIRSDKDIKRVIISNLQGQRIFNQGGEKINQIAIPQSFVPGIYFIDIMNISNEIANLKFVVID